MAAGESRHPYERREDGGMGFRKPQPPAVEVHTTAPLIENPEDGGPGVPSAPLPETLNSVPANTDVQGVNTNPLEKVKNTTGINTNSYQSFSQQFTPPSGGASTRVTHNINGEPVDHRGNVIREGKKTNEPSSPRR